MNVKEHEITKNEMEDLISIVTHEIKNPIALIKANVEYLCACDEKLSNIGEKNFKIINNQLNKIMQLTYEYTALVKFNNRKKIDIYLYDLLYNVYCDYKSSYSDIKFEFIYQQEDKDIEIKANFMLLDIAVRNLVKNSVEVVQRGSGKVVIKLVKVNEMIKIIVQDNGGGFKDIHIENAKNKFCTTKENGTGLGLFITDYIIKEHNGYFDLKADNKGCVATILL